MLTTMTALALAAVAQTAPAVPATIDHAQTGQADGSKVSHSMVSHSNMVQHGCCKRSADGKMECAMLNKAGDGSAHQGHSGH